MSINIKKKQIKTWDWRERIVQQEIRMADFYSGRQIILKYLPHQGKILDAGCGLGRYVFYLYDLGYKICGIDNSARAINQAKKFAKKYQYPVSLFKVANVERLPYPNKYFSGLISLGVIEHFKHGPSKSIIESFRVLKPSGIAIFCVPNRYSLEFLGKRIINIKREFFQYNFSLGKLANFIKKAGFKIIDKKIIDLRYPVYQIFRFKIKNLNLFQKIKNKLFKTLDFLENTPLSVFGGLSFVIAQKLPLTSSKIENAKFFNSEEIIPQKSICYFCQKKFQKNKIFGYYGFVVAICLKCLRKKTVYKKIVQKYLSRIWREYD